MDAARLQRRVRRRQLEACSGAGRPLAQPTRLAVLAALVAALVCPGKLPRAAVSPAVAAVRKGAGPDDRVLVMNKMCPFAQRAWFALEESGLGFKLEETSLGSSLVYSLNSRGLVPILVDTDGTVTVESEDIVDVIARSSARITEGSSADAEIRQLVNGRLLPAGKKAKLFGGAGDVEPILRELEGKIVGPYMTGDGISVADLSAAPMLQRMFEDKMVPSGLSRLHAWWEAVRARPGFRKTVVRSYWWWW